MRSAGANVVTIYHHSCPDPFSCVAACANLHKLVVCEEGHKQKRGVTQRSALTRCPSAWVPAMLCHHAKGFQHRLQTHWWGNHQSTGCAYVPTEGKGREGFEMDLRKLEVDRLEIGQCRRSHHLPSLLPQPFLLRRHLHQPT